ncbi:MAG: hypothetical protein ACR2LN_02190, partial [Candidatus Levyibacteriota bacterium]
DRASFIMAVSSHFSISATFFHAQLYENYSSIKYAILFFAGYILKSVPGMDGVLRHFNPSPAKTQYSAGGKIAETVTDAIEVFIGETAFALSPPGSSEEAVRDQIGIVDDCYKVGNEALFNFHREMRRGGLLDIFLTGEIRQLGSLALHGKHARNLLFTGQLEETDPFVKELIWRLEVKRNESLKRLKIPGTNQQTYAQIDEYFFDHADLQEVFWSEFLTTGGNESSYDFKYASSFCEANPEEIEKFLRTIPLGSMESGDQKRLLTQLVTVTVMMKQQASTRDVPWSGRATDAMIDALEKVAGEAGLRRTIVGELAVLADTIPGFITLGDALQGQAVVSKGDQTREEFIASNSDLVVMYESTAPWPEKGQRKDVEVEPRLVVSSEQVASLPPWQDVHIPEDQVVGPLLNHLHRRVLISEELRIVNELNAFRRNLSQEPRIRTRRKPAIVPFILPQSHPLRILHEIGVDALQFEGDDIKIIIDAERAHMNFENGRRLLVEGAYDSVDDSVFILGEDDSDNPSAFNVALTAACRWAYTRFVDNGERVTKGVNKLVQQWDERRTTDPTLPSLEYDAGYGIRNTPTVLTEIDNLPVILTLKETQNNV